MNLLKRCMVRREWESEMSEAIKAKVINDILGALRQQAELRMNTFPAGVTFFRLCFLSDSELERVARLCGVNFPAVK